jgi:hypothetical protein
MRIQHGQSRSKACEAKLAWMHKSVAKDSFSLSNIVARPQAKFLTRTRQSLDHAIAISPVRSLNVTTRAVHLNPGNEEGRVWKKQSV